MQRRSGKVSLTMLRDSLHRSAGCAAASLRYALLAGVLMSGTAIGDSAPRAAAESPAFQGHSAEMAMRDAAAERRHRALFFDSVDLEIGTPGLPCDHVRRSKPHAVAGIGYVVLLMARADRAALLRVWFPPGDAASSDDARAKALAALETHWPGAVLQSTDLRQFHWCR